MKQERKKKIKWLLQRMRKSMVFIFYPVSEQEGFTSVPSMDVPLLLEVAMNMKDDVTKCQDRWETPSGVYWVSLYGKDPIHKETFSWVRHNVSELWKDIYISPSSSVLYISARRTSEMTVSLALAFLHHPWSYIALWVQWESTTVTCKVLLDPGPTSLPNPSHVWVF